MFVAMLQVVLSVSQRLVLRLQWFNLFSSTSDLQKGLSVLLTGASSQRAASPTKQVQAVVTVAITLLKQAARLVMGGNISGDCVAPAVINPPKVTGKTANEKLEQHTDDI